MAPSEQSSPSRTIVLIHGLWLTPRSWEHWKERYEARGHQVIAPAWPGMEPEVEALRAEPAALTQLDFKKVADHYERIIRDLDSPPIIIGHSIGGALTQVLLDRGLGSAGVGIAPAAVKGNYDISLSTLRASRPVLGNPLNRSKATPLTQKQFHYAFGNTMSRQESDAVYDRYAV